MLACTHTALRWAGAALGLALSLTSIPAAIAEATITPGAVYTEMNGAAGNAIAVFRRAADGTLTPAGLVPTGGTGTGAGLGSQGAVILSEDGRRLFAVNAGSSDISVFDIGPHGLTLVSRTPSGGVMPISLTLHGNLLYVLNAGGVNNITGFTVAADGTLNPIPDSARPLSAPSPSPAEVAFSPSGAVLTVTEKATNLIDTYVVAADGTPVGPMPQASSGATPFGFAFDNRGELIVSEASGSVSSYEVGDDGALQVVTASAPTHNLAPCWIAVTPSGRYAYTTNAHNGIISGFSVDPGGSLTLLDTDGVTAATGAGSSPIDMAMSVNGRYLNVLLSGNGSIGTFRVQSNGSLAPIGVAGSLPAGTTGLAAH